MTRVKSIFAIALLGFAGAVSAGSNSHGQQRHGAGHQQRFDYARVIDVQPLYRQIKVSSPVSECWDVPVYHTHDYHPKSAGGIIAGGLIGGIVGNQFGRGRGKNMATAIGTLIGAQVGHRAVNGNSRATRGSSVEYREHCEVSQRASYEQVIDGYHVTYQFQGHSYQVEMPYHPGKRIKMRIQFSPVI